MSRIYVVTNRAAGDDVVERYVRAKNLNAAIRAVAHEQWTAHAATTDEVYQAMKDGAAVLDALEEKADGE